ncbi:immunoglobulin I-set domain protein [Streptomyces sp. NPDC050418]|uniref:immunoglobulin I-set domain protein n=1 Tax=Streptomyces sp. NPDC050418 TaxID=3365612 RepID=UPI0037AC18E9
MTAAALTLGAAVAGLLTGPAAADDSAKTGLGENGQKLTVAKSAGLDPAGETVHITGEGYDASKGIYVAFCRDNGAGRVPAPCVGGAAVEGGTKSSAWIVPANDPNVGELADAYGPDGSFAVDLELKAKDGGLDCTKVTCSVVTRVDHRAPGDRSQDVRIPVTFEGQAPGDPGEGVDGPEGTVSYRADAGFAANTAGRVTDLLVHPESKKLYAAANDLLDQDGMQQGLYVLDPATGALRTYVQNGPRANGTLGPMIVNRIADALPGDGVVFTWGLRGLAWAKDGDENADGLWLTGSTVGDVGPGVTAGTTLVSQKSAPPVLGEIETATGTVKRSLTLDGGALFAVDAARKAVWWADPANKKLYRVDTGTFTVSRTVELPVGDASERLLEVDPATGSVWYGHGTGLHVFGQDGTPKGTVDGNGVDLPSDVAFAGNRAYTVWQDPANSGDAGSDGNGELTVSDTGDLEKAAETLALDGYDGGLGSAVVEVADGGRSVYTGNPLNGTLHRFVRQTSPKVVEAPTDLSVTAGDAVTLSAEAEGEPEPSVQWQVSPDGGQTWKDVEGATEKTFDFAAKAGQNGYQYRAEFENAAGKTRTRAATLTVDAEAPGGGSEGSDGGSGGGEEPNGTGKGTGPKGQELTVTPVHDLAVEQQKVQISGTGYDESIGIYVALCVDNGAGEVPTPCVGGADMTGEGGASVWISNDPPAGYEDIAKPYGKDGAFEVELTVDAKDEYTDCLKTKCVIATRADHTKSADRSQDVRVAVDFAGGAGSGGADGGGADGGGAGSAGGSSAGSVGGTGGAGSGSLASTGATVASLAAAAALLVAGGWYAVRRTRRTGAGAESEDGGGLAT